MNNTEINELYISRRTQEVKSKAGWKHEALEFYNDLSMDLPNDWFERMTKVWKLTEWDNGKIDDELYL